MIRSLAVCITVLPGLMFLRNFDKSNSLSQYTLCKRYSCANSGTFPDRLQMSPHSGCNLLPACLSPHLFLICLYCTKEERDQTDNFPCFSVASPENEW